MLPAELSGHLLKYVPNLKIIQSLPKFHWKRLLNPIFDQFPPNFANGDLCQVNSYEKNATFIIKKISGGNKKSTFKMAFSIAFLSILE